jgi:hypothetical protein
LPWVCRGRQLEVAGTLAEVTPGVGLAGGMGVQGMGKDMEGSNTEQPRKATPTVAAATAAVEAMAVEATEVAAAPRPVMAVATVAAAAVTVLATAAEGEGATVVVAAAAGVSRCWTSSERLRRVDGPIPMVTRRAEAIRVAGRRLVTGVCGRGSACWSSLAVVRLLGRPGNDRRLSCRAAALRCCFCLSDFFLTSLCAYAFFC